MAQEYQTYTVKGSWPFPTDMLRYDDAKPATVFASETINRLSGDYAPSRESIRDEVEIRLIRIKRGLPAIDRWESFGWKVVNGDEDTQYAIAVRNPPPLEPTPYEKLRAAVKDVIAELDYTPKYVYAREDDLGKPLPPRLMCALNELTNTYNETPEARHGNDHP
ncbi:hypothetical protein D869_gp139 [Caulobacter phage CcrRogue]|uniref:Uncharacterized protein n=1 Tax=Caulobacter phage CcrRogue TaxID=2927986 RepID=K4JR58_9CAUD|nr:hypothetical protein D869_gp139 [Caulobacter phage CcrRogue]AFU86775.1 hypothetical protein CcrRogue_gp293 [Caulobacter phage CcrRogue]